jgi:ATP-dependent protease ClpP protease subunit
MGQDVHVRRMEDKVARTGARIVEQATLDGTALRDLPGLTLRWYAVGQQQEVRGQADEPGGGQPTTTETSIYIYDEIGGSFGTTADQFAEDLNAIDSDVIRVRINSPGGSVKDGLAIMNTMRAHPSRIVAHVDGMALSAASVVMLGADEVVIEPGGEVMTHNASTEVSGEAATLESYATWLRRQSENIAGLYSQRSGRPLAEWQELMDAETWFYGQEAVDIGLADRAESLARPTGATGEVAERMARRHAPRGYKHGSRADAGPPRPASRVKAAAPAAARSGARVPSEVRDAAQLRRRAMDRGLVHRNAPAGITTQARRSAPSGDIAQETVEHRGRQMFRTHGAFTVYGRGYEMWDMYGPYVEKVYAGSGSETMTARDLDCVFLLNHTGTTMARTAGPWNDYRGTLNLQEKPDQGWHEAFLSVTRPDVTSMMEAINDRLITEMSYAFLIVDGRWNDDMTEFGIHLYDMDRGDVSAVNYGANPYTDITARASEILGELQQMPAGAIGEAVRILSQRVGAYEQLLRDADPGALARITEPALMRGAEITSADRVKAAKWVTDAFQDGRPDPEPEPERAADDTEPTKVIDKTPDSGPTVAGYEALLEAMGYQVPQ